MKFKYILLFLFILAGCKGGSSNPADEFLGLNGLTQDNYTGAASIIYNPTSYNFGYVSTTSGIQTKTITILNRNSASVYIQQLTSVDDTTLRMSSNNCPISPIPLPTNTTCDIIVTFNPTAKVAETLTLTTVFSESIGGTTYRLDAQISGEGVPPLVFSGLDPISATTVSTTKVKLEWAGIANVDQYRVSKIVAGVPITIADIASSNSNYTVTGLNPNTSYTFRVNAINVVNIGDGNTNDRSVTTDVVGAFGAIAAINTSEGLTATSVSLDTLCTDIEANTASSFVITTQSDADVSCSVIGSPNRIQCSPVHKSGHSAWSATVGVSCYLNDYATAYTQTLTVNVADTNRSPSITALADQTIVFGNAIATVDANSTNDLDPDGDTITYTCRYDTVVDGAVAGGSDCNTLTNLDTSAVSFNTASGILNWTPALANAGITYEFKISASDGSLSYSDVFTVAVDSPPPSPSQTTIAVSAGSVTSASSVNVTIQAKDSLGNNLASGAAVVVLGYSGGTSTGTFSAVTDNNNGTYSATFTGVTAGTATTITGTINGVAISSALPTVTVSAGAVDVLKSSMVAGTNALTAGSVTPLTVTLRDVNNNIIPTGAPAVVMYKESGVSAGTIAAVVAVGDGTYTSTFSATTSGTAAVLRATINGVAITSTLPTIQVNPGPISYSVSSVLGQTTTVPVGGSISVTLTAKDSFGNTHTAGGITGLVFSHSGGTSTGTFSAVIDNGDGTYRTNFTGVTLGTTTTIQVAEGATPFTNTMPTVIVEAADPDVAQSLITVSSATVASGSNVTLTFNAKTASSANITYGGDTIAFTYAGGTSTGIVFPVTATDNNDGTYSAVFNGVSAGTATSIGATINGVPFTGVKPTVTVTAGPLAQVEFVSTPAVGLSTGALSPAPVVRLKDANGNVLTNDSATTVTLSIPPAGAGGSLTGTTSKVVTNGVADFTGTSVGFDTNGTQYLRATAGVFTQDSSAITVITPTLTLTKTVADDLRISYLNTSFVHPTKSTAEAIDTNTATIASTSFTALLTLSGTSPLTATANARAHTNISVAGFTDVTNIYKYWTFTTARNNSVASTCSFPAPYAAFTCTLSGSILVTFNELANAAMTNQKLKVSDGFTNSNEFDVTKFEIVKAWDYYTAGNDNPRWLQVFNSRLYFSSAANTNNANLKVHSLYNDGSRYPIVNSHSRTRSTADNSQDYSLYSTVGASALYFTARNTANKDKLYRLNTDNSIDQISDIISGNHDGFNGNLIEFNGRLYFTAYNANNKRKLFVYNPGNSTITLVYDFRGDNTVDDDPSYFRVVNNTFYFSALNPSGKSKLYSIDSSHTVLTQISNQRGTGNNDVFNEMIQFNGNTYLSIYRAAANHNKIHKLSGGNIEWISDTRTNSQDSPLNFTVWNGYMYFTAQNTGNRRRIFRMDTSEQIEEVTDIVSGVTDDVYDLTIWNNYLVFRSRTSNSSSEKVFLMDSNHKSYQISDFVPSGGDDEPRNFKVFDGDLYFTARKNSLGHQVIYRVRETSSLP